MARFYRDSFNNDRNVSDKLPQDSSLKSPKLFLNPGKGVLYHRSIMFHVVEQNILVAYIPKPTHSLLVE